MTTPGNPNFNLPKFGRTQTPPPTTEKAPEAVITPANAERPKKPVDTSVIPPPDRDELPTDSSATDQTPRTEGASRSDFQRVHDEVNAWKTTPDEARVEVGSPADNPTDRERVWREAAQTAETQTTPDLSTNTLASLASSAMQETAVSRDGLDTGSPIEGKTAPSEDAKIGPETGTTQQATSAPADSASSTKHDQPDPNKNPQGEGNPNEESGASEPLHQDKTLEVTTEDRPERAQSDKSDPEQPTAKTEEDGHAQDNPGSNMREELGTPKDKTAPESDAMREALEARLKTDPDNEELRERLTKLDDAGTVGTKDTAGNSLQEPSSPLPEKISGDVWAKDPNTGGWVHANPESTAHENPEELNPQNVKQQFFKHLGISPNDLTAEQAAQLDERVQEWIARQKIESGTGEKADQPNLSQSPHDYEVNPKVPLDEFLETMREVYAPPLESNLPEEALTEALHRMFGLDQPSPSETLVPSNPEAVQKIKEILDKLADVKVSETAAPNNPTLNSDPQIDEASLRAFVAGYKDPDVQEQMVEYIKSLPQNEQDAIVAMGKDLREQELLRAKTQADTQTETDDGKDSGPPKPPEQSPPSPRAAADDENLLNGRHAPVAEDPYANRTFHTKGDIWWGLAGAIGGLFASPVRAATAKVDPGKEEPGLGAYSFTISKGIGSAKVTKLVTVYGAPNPAAAKFMARLKFAAMLM